MMADDFIEQIRQAAGGAALHAVAAVRIRGNIRAGGMSGPYEQLVELDGGHSLTAFTLGPAKVSRGYDGATAWQRTATGEVLAQDAQAALQVAATEAYMHARGYLFPERWPAQMQTPVERSEDGRAFLVVQAVPAGGQPVHLWFDRATMLLERSVQNVVGKDSAKRLSDYRSVGGIPFAHRIATGTGDPRFDVVIELDGIELNPAIAAGLFGMPVQAFDDASFADGADSASIPAELANNHLYLSATVNGVALRLMVDTGSVNLLTPEAARRAGVAVEGALEARGPGEHSVNAGMARVDRLVIGGAVVLERLLLRVVPLPDFDQIEGTQVDGVIGYETFKRFAVRLDYGNETVTFAAPGALAPLAGEATLPLTFYAHLPAVDGMLDGVAGQFWLDTGNRNALTLWTPFVNANGVLDRYRCSGETTIGWGVGGATRGRVARAASLMLGVVDAGAPVLTLPLDSDGPTATRNVAGNVGGDVLRRFVVTFDYAAKVVHFAPALAAAAPYDYDRSGMWINREGDSFLVKSVMQDGPAQEAGIRPGDRIGSVDGVPASAVTLTAMRAKLRDCGAVSLLLECADVKLVLRDYC